MKKEQFQIIFDFSQGEYSNIIVGFHKLQESMEQLYVMFLYLLN